MANKLSLNVAKTEFMLIGSRQMIKGLHPTFFLLKTNKLNKLINALDIIVDQHLPWKNNARNVCTKFTAVVCAFRRIKPSKKH